MDNLFDFYYKNSHISQFLSLSTASTQLEQQKSQLQPLEDSIAQPQFYSTTTTTINNSRLHLDLNNHVTPNSGPNINAQYNRSSFSPPPLPNKMAGPNSHNSFFSSTPPTPNSMLDSLNGQFWIVFLCLLFLSYTYFFKF